MNKLNLKASNDYEKAILDYLESNASDALAEKINNGNKTLAQCFAYIRGQAQKEAKNNCAMIEDKVVYGWAVHFFEEDEIDAKGETESEGTGKTKPIPEPKKIIKKTEMKKKPTKIVEKNEEQLSLFALLG